MISFPLATEAHSRFAVARAVLMKNPSEVFYDKQYFKGVAQFSISVVGLGLILDDTGNGNEPLGTNESDFYGGRNP